MKRINDNKYTANIYIHRINNSQLLITTFNVLMLTTLKIIVLKNVTDIWEGTATSIYPEEGNGKFLQSMCKFVGSYRTSPLRRQHHSVIIMFYAL